MALRIMENKRIPRKIKKALKYAFLHPRVCGRLIRYGAVYTIGRNSKWTRKAAKIKRQRDYAEMIHNITEQLAEVKNVFRTSYDQALNSAIAEDIKVKQNEIASIQTQIEFNQQVADDNSKYISKLKDLIS